MVASKEPVVKNNRMAATPGTELCEKIDLFEAKLSECPQIDFPLNHLFTPGLYCRTIFMPKGALLTSKIHLTEHPYVILKGRVSVWTEEAGVKHLDAPYMGVTRAGTRRILYIHEDTVWATFHPTDKRNVDEIEGEIILKHDDHIRIDGHIMEKLSGGNS